MKHEVLKPMSFMRVGSRLTVALTYTTGYLEKPLFCLLCTDADAHKCFKINAKTYMVSRGAQTITLRMRSKSGKRKSMYVSIELKSSFKKRRIGIMTQ